MRMRKKKNGDKRLALCSEFIFDMPDSPLEKPCLVFGKEEAEVFLEIGAGKGGFACGTVKANPNAVYFAMERVSDCVVLAAELASETEGVGADNLRFIIDTADNLVRYFAPKSADRIFLNFSDPWSKKGYAKRRLTHRRYLALYFNLLKDGGVLTFKTDNVGLFDFSLEEIASMGLECKAVTRDLHASPYAEGNVMTEYERAFSSQGVKINMLSVVKPEGFMPPISDELKNGKIIYRKADSQDD